MSISKILASFKSSSKVDSKYFVNPVQTPCKLGAGWWRNCYRHSNYKPAQSEVSSRHVLTREGWTHNIRTCHAILGLPEQRFPEGIINCMPRQPLRAGWGLGTQLGMSIVIYPPWIWVPPYFAKLCFFLTNKIVPGTVIKHQQSGSLEH